MVKYVKDNKHKRAVLKKPASTLDRTILSAGVVKKTKAKYADQIKANQAAARARRLAKLPAAAREAREAKAGKPKAKVSKPELRARRKANAAKLAADKAKAAAAAKATKKGKTLKRTRKVRYNVHFRRPHTLRLPSKPRYARTAAGKQGKNDEFSIVRYPLMTESSMKKIEVNNTLTFIVAVTANKPSIRRAVEKLYDVKVVKVNTLIRPDNTKKAYVRLSADHDALVVANKISIV
eukprot:TRINITY_DN7488_c0_g1_i1.p1 TRINITY_DN7488_c0_g1~~TRINITY_DN7488_c0_g1_i1.p1  ORF type:complete len:236 (-),score=122.76 TRINITY_DN7488_c0_g1_i1:118-825(-)